MLQGAPVGQLTRNPGTDQLPGNTTGLIAGTAKYGKVSETAVLFVSAAREFVEIHAVKSDTAHHLFNGLADDNRFGLVGRRFQNGQCLHAIDIRIDAALMVRLFSQGTGLNHLKGRSQDGFRGTVVAPQPDGLCAGIITRKTIKIADIRAPKTIYGLIGVTDDANPGFVRRKAAQQTVLRIIDILEFIHENMGETVLNLTPPRFFLFQHADHLEKQVLEIVKILKAQQLLINFIDLLEYGRQSCSGGKA